MKILTAIDGNLIVVAHITKVWYGLDHDAYKRVSLAHFILKKDVEKAQDPELEKALKEAMLETYPGGEPRMTDFYRTRVTLSDGSSHWVKASRDDVVRALLDA